MSTEGGTKKRKLPEGKVTNYFKSILEEEGSNTESMSEEAFKGEQKEWLKFIKPSHF